MLPAARLTPAFLAVMALLLAAQVAAHYAPSTWINRDGRFYTNVNVTLVDDGRIVQERFASSWYRRALGWNDNIDVATSNVAMGRDGSLLPKHPLLLPLLSTPLFWAFDVPGTLLFNLLAFLFAAAAVYRFACRHGRPVHAALAALLFSMGTALQLYAYDYHVDVLLLALFGWCLVFVGERRGLWAGLCFGLVMTLKPTSVIWAPSLALLVAEQRQPGLFRRSVIGSAVVLAVFALSNAWLFGMPWWFGYTRTIVMVDGVMSLAAPGESFSRDFAEGVRDVFFGRYGLRDRFALLCLAGPGLLSLMARRPLYALAALWGVLASVLVFSFYVWPGDRFHWPGMALLVPALARTLVLADEGARRIARRGLSTSNRAALLTALCVMAMGVVSNDRASVIGLSLLAMLAFAVARVGAWLAPAALAAAITVGAFTVAPLDVWLRPQNVPPQAAASLDGLLAWVCAACLGLVALARTRSMAAVVLGGLSLAALGGAIGWDHDHAMALACLPLLPLGAAAAEVLGGLLWRGLRSLRPRGGVKLLAAALAALLLLGLGRRIANAGRPFELADGLHFRRAQVSLGDEPCDFLAWEHMSWECVGQARHVSLRTGQPSTVGGNPVRYLQLPSGLDGRAGRVRWSEVPLGPRFELAWAVSDDAMGGGTLRVRVDDRLLMALKVADAPDGRIRRTVLDTGARGETGSLELELSPPDVSRPSTVVVQGRFLR
ncbi:MAG: DUF2029 domain-containing protein [Myxococcales bacterium]|nr:DUF2029 domain-containing protein [Myxococcales bacterium]